MLAQPQPSPNQREHPANGQAPEWAVEWRLLQQLRFSLHQVLFRPAVAASLELGVPPPFGPQHRIVIMNERLLRSGGDLIFVGFFGRLRPGIDAEQLVQVDAELVAQFEGHPYVLSYSSVQFAENRWANLVIMDTPTGLRRWAESERHAFAAHVVAPACYTHVRLHIGALPSGLSLDGPMIVNQTREISYGHHVVDCNHV